MHMWTGGGGHKGSIKLFDPVAIWSDQRGIGLLGPSEIRCLPTWRNVIKGASAGPFPESTSMSSERLVSSPVCQLPPKAMTALEQATIDDVLREGAFSEMGHLPAAAVLADALQYADTMLEGLREGASRALSPGLTEVSLLDLPLMAADANFLSQVLALQDLAVANAVNADAEATHGPTLAELADAARGHLLDRYHSWVEEPGRRSDNFRAQKGDMDYLYPVAVVKGSSAKLTPGNRADAFACFVALPLMGPFLVHEDDCFIAPRLE